MFQTAPCEVRTLRDTCKLRNSSEIQFRLHQQDVEKSASNREDGSSQEGHTQEVFSEARGEEGASGKEIQDQRRRGKASSGRWDDSAGDTQHQLRTGVPVQHYYRNFKVFCKENKFKNSKRDQIDAILADYFDVLFLENRSAAEGEKTLASIEFYMHSLRGKLVRSRKALRGWRKLKPPKSRLPLPKPVTWAIAMRLLFKEEKEMALAVLLAFDVYLRPGETSELRVHNLVKPVIGAGSQYKECSRQDGRFQQHSEAGQPGDQELVGTCTSPDESKEKGGGEALSVRPSEIQKSLSRSGLLDWLAKSSLVSALTRRSFRRPRKSTARPQCCQGPRALDDGHISETICEDGKGASYVEQAARVGSPIWEEVDREDASGDQEDAESLEKLQGAMLP